MTDVVLKRKPKRNDDIGGLYDRPGWDWLKSEWFCPSCGKQDMWQMSDQYPDYYHDCVVECHSCGHQMCCVGRVGESDQ